MKIIGKVIIMATLLSILTPNLVLASMAPQYDFQIKYSDDAFGDPTTSSVAADYSATENIRKNKDVTYFPPVYGVFSGEIPTNLTSNYHTPDANKSTVTAIPDFGGVTVLNSEIGYLASTSLMAGADYPDSNSIAISYMQEYSKITSVEKYSDGSIGYIYVPAFGETVKIYEGTDANTLKKGAGHFNETSQWHGLVGLAGHNRGSYDYFYFVKSLEIGDTISYTTKEGTRTYKVYLKEKIYEDDASYLSDTSDNVLCLITCVENQSDLRWVVLASEIK